MHGLGLLYALMGSLGGSAKPPAPASRSTGVDPVEPLDDATYDAWSAWARSERRRLAAPIGPAVPGTGERPAPPVVGRDRGVLGRI
jgi:hypothetical protein